MFKALSDPVRLRLFSSDRQPRRRGGVRLRHLAGVDVSQPTISHHLKVLRDAGLLTLNAARPGCITRSSPRR